MVTQPLAIGTVESLCVNGEAVQSLLFWIDGPSRDTHSGLERRLSGHDGEYIRTSALKKDSNVFNWRSWTGLSVEEITEVENALGCGIPQGCLLENITVSGVPQFSKLAPTTRLVFPEKKSDIGSQAILAIWEENSPCKGVGDRLEQHYNQPGLKTRFIAEAQNKRGVMGFVLAAGWINVGDTVLVYPPVR